MKKYILKSSNVMMRLSESFPTLTPVDVKSNKIEFIDFLRDTSSIMNAYDNVEHENMGFVKELEKPYLIFTGSNLLHHVTVSYVWEIFKEQQDFDLICFDAHLDLGESNKMMEESTIEYNNFMIHLLLCTGHKVNAFNIGSTYNQGSLFWKETDCERETPYCFEHNYFANMTLEDILRKSKDKVYVSIDLDCLHINQFTTDSFGGKVIAGKMSLKRLEAGVKNIFQKKRVLGMDVCGFEGISYDHQGYRKNSRGINAGKRIIKDILSWV